MQERSQPELYALQQRLQAAESPREVALCAVNESAAALAYEQAVVWGFQPAARAPAVVGSGLRGVLPGRPHQGWGGRPAPPPPPPAPPRPGAPPPPASP